MIRQQRYHVIKEGGQEVHKLIKETNKKLKASSGHPDWKAYVDYVNDSIVAGLIQVGTMMMMMMMMVVVVVVVVVKMIMVTVMMIMMTMMMTVSSVCPQVVVSTLEIVDRQLDPLFIAKNNLMPLLEVELDLRSNTVSCWRKG
jgi:thiaminase